MRATRPFVVLLVCAVALASPVWPLAAAPVAPQAGYAGRAHAQSSAPVHLGGNVVQRETTAVRSAEAGLDAVAAGRSIVDFAAGVADPQATADRLARQLGFTPAMIYTSGVPGFAADLTPEQIAALGKRPEVARIAPDRLVPLPRAYGMPTGVSRIGTLANKTAQINGTDERVNADVAILDSGIDFDHPDLNIAGWYDCTAADGQGWDDVGHGTHVAGTIGALDDGVGVVGVAPGARIWAIKIFTVDGALQSWIRCGLQILADNGDTFEVANLSWGWYEAGADGPCSETAVHQLICDAYDAGVTIVNAAGNNKRDASNDVPTTYSQVIAVSALADSDGRPGGKGGSTSYGADDAFATFSNYGADIDIAAPGVDILSTYPTYFSSDIATGLEVESGTSMATPHVVGAAALYIARNGRVGPAAVRTALRTAGDPTAMAGDPDGIREPVLYVGVLNPACTASPTSGAPGASVTLACTNFRADEAITVRWDTSSGTRIGSIAASSRGNGSATLTIPPAIRGTHKLVAKGATSGRSVQVSLTVRAAVTLSPTSGPAGTAVTLTLAGFGRNEAITVTYEPGRAGQQTLSSGKTTSSVGSASIGVVIPANAVAGSRKIEVRGAGGAKVTKAFTVTGVSAAEASGTPSATPAASPTVTATATAVEPATATPTPMETATAEPTSEPTVAPSPTPEATATPEPTAEEPVPTAEVTAEP